MLKQAKRTTLNRNATAALVAALALSVLVATVALAVSASNPHHDSEATSGRLEKGCKYFEIDASDTLKTRCNKVTATGITTVEDTTDLSPHITDESCRGQTSKIEPFADRVIVHYGCGPGTDFSRDLNDSVSWDSTTGQTKLKTKYPHNSCL